MIKIFINFLFSIRKVFQYFFIKIFEKFRDPKTGKFTVISPRNFVSLLYISGIILFFIIVASQLMNGKNNVSSGLDEFKKELTPKVGINAAMSGLMTEVDPLGELLKLSNKNAGSDKKSIDTDIKTGDIAPSKNECNMLMDRIAKGETLKGEENEKLNVCLDQNIGQWNNDQKEFAKTLLNNNNLTEEEKKLLSKGIAGTLNSEELAKAKSLSEKQSDPNKGLTEVAQNAKESSTKEISPEKLKVLADELLKKDAELKQLEQKVAEAQAEAIKAGKSISEGKALSQQETESIAKLAEVKKLLDVAKKEHDEKKAVISKAVNKLQQDLAGVAVTIDKVVPSGAFVAYDEDIAVKKPNKKNKNENIIFGLDGNPLSPDKVKLISLRRKKAIDMDRLLKDGKNSNNFVPVGTILSDGRIVGKNKEILPAIGEDGKLVDPKSLPLGTVLSDGRIIGKDGTVLPAAGEDGALVDSNSLPLGTVLSDGRIVGKDGKLVGKDGTPIDQSILPAGTILSDGRTVGKNGQVISNPKKEEQNVDKGIPVGTVLSDGKILGKNGMLVSDPGENGKISDISSLPLGTVLSDGRIVGKNGVIIPAPGEDGRVNTNNLPVGTVLSDGRTVGKNGVLIPFGEDAQVANLINPEKTEMDIARENILNPTGSNSGFTKGIESMDLASLFTENGIQSMELTQNVVYSNRSLKAFSLTPDMKIPAVLLTTVLVSDKGRPQVVRVKVLDDVYNPESNDRVIPKGSIIVGSTSSFDPETGVMDMSFDKVSIGSGKVINSRFIVGSANGSMGLKGQIRDTRGKYLLGAFVTSFSAGALQWFSQSVVSTFTQQTDPANALLGAGMGGGADVMSKIAEMYAGDLQNAAKIFYAVKGIPLILYPSE